jgi:hypothetical protein
MAQPVVFTKQEDEWLQNVMNTYMNMGDLHSPQEQALHDSIVAKLVTADDGT